MFIAKIAKNYLCNCVKIDWIIYMQEKNQHTNCNITMHACCMLTKAKHPSPKLQLSPLLWYFVKLFSLKCWQAISWHLLAALATLLMTRLSWIFNIKFEVWPLWPLDWDITVHLSKLHSVQLICWKIAERIHLLLELNCNKIVNSKKFCTQHCLICF